MRYYFLLNGQQPDMARAEVAGATAAEGLNIGPSWRPDPRLLVADVDAPWPDVARACARLGLCHEAGPLVARAGYDMAALRRTWLDVVPRDASIAGRAQRLAAGAWDGGTVERAVGDLAGRRVDLGSPDVVLRGFQTRRSLVVGWQRHVRRPADEDARHVKNRPFFSPISVEPRWARAMVNLARVPRGGLVVDPFVGTGGVLIEAGALGCRVAGADLDPEMVTGARANLDHFGVRAEAMVVSDIAKAAEALSAAGVGPAQAMVSDLPYGRSASTGREDRQLLYMRAARAARSLVRPGGRVVVGTPGGWPRVRGLRREASFALRVHRSLTRRFHVLRRV